MSWYSSPLSHPGPLSGQLCEVLYASKMRHGNYLCGFALTPIVTVFRRDGLLLFHVGPLWGCFAKGRVRLFFLLFEYCLSAIIVNQKDGRMRPSFLLTLQS